MPPSSSLCSTDATWITSRVSSNGFAPCQPSGPSRWIQTVTFVPGAPRR